MLSLPASFLGWSISGIVTFSAPEQALSGPAVRPMAAHLEDVSTDDLIREVQRRIECAIKPEKHVVLIGRLQVQCLMHVCIGWAY